MLKNESGTHLKLLKEVTMGKDSIHAQDIEMLASYDT
jgi:hypothetical protein